VHLALGMPIASWCYRCGPNSIDEGRYHLSAGVLIV